MPEKDALSNEEVEAQERMKEFIREHGGKVNFAQFQTESLYGKGAFYQDKISIGERRDNPDHDFQTYAMNPIFAYLLLNEISDVIGKAGGKVVELAGGNGVLKSNLLGMAAERGIKLDYLSLDISMKLAGQQKASGGEAAVGSALRLPLGDKSIEGMIFMNELLDNFPCRVVRAVMEHTEYGTYPKYQRLEELYYVLNEDDQIEAAWEPAGEDLEDYWERMKMRMSRGGVYPEIEWGETRVFSIQSEIETFMKELDRVFKDGEVVIFDYGDTTDRLTERKYVWEMKPRIYPQSKEVAIEQMPEKSYQVDITVSIDFGEVMYWAEKYGFDFKFYKQGEYFGMLMTEEDWEKYYTDPEMKKKWEAWSKTGENPLSNIRNFRVLVLKRKA